LSSYLLAFFSTLALAGLPVAWRLRNVLRQASEEGIQPADAILVLGRKLADDAITPVFEARLNHALGLWRQGFAPRLLVTGGITGRACLSEGAAGRAWLLDQGVPAEAILTEDRSQHTLENLFWVREQVREAGWQSLIIVSDPLHLARAQAMAEGLGLRTLRCPASAAPPVRGSFGWWKRALSEAFLLHWYHTGMAYSRLIGSQKQLDRVT
jgi:uncharacterized SAM-binding protein YcdF (DUF218 family)